MQTQTQRDRRFYSANRNSAIYLSTVQTAGLHVTIIKDAHYRAQTAIPTIRNVRRIIARPAANALGARWSIDSQVLIGTRSSRYFQLK